MAVQIQSTINGIVTTASRNDAKSGDQVTLEAVGAATTWSWALVYAPQDKDRNDSSASLAGALNGPGPITFMVDNEGAYLIRLIVDSGLPSEQIIFVRIRCLTKFAGLSLVAAGERKDDQKNPPNIPWDASTVGWANDQNFNINKLLELIRHVSASGRIVYVDANRGKLNSNTPNDPTIAQDWADFSTITQAISAATIDPKFNGGVPPTVDSPIIIAVRPGLYEENIVFVPFVHVIAWPSEGSILDNWAEGDRSVTVRTTTAGGLTHILTPTSATDYNIIRGIHFVNSKVTVNPIFQKVGLGATYFLDCRITQKSNAVTSGSCLSVLRGSVFVESCVLNQQNTNGDRLVLEVNPSVAGSAQVWMRNSQLAGPCVAELNVNLSPSVDVRFHHCDLIQKGVDPSSFGIVTNASTTIFSRSEGYLENGNTNFLQVNETGAGAPGDVLVGIYWSRFGQVSTSGIRQGVEFNTTNIVGNSILEMGSSEISSVTEVGVNPVIKRASTLGTTVHYDNSVSGIAAENVQDAIDETISLIPSIPSLDDVYNVGRIIKANVGAVEIHGPGLETNPPPLNPENGDGTHRVYQQVEIGAIGDPEVGIYSNNCGNGPSLEMGSLGYNMDSFIGSSGHILANSVSNRNFNLRIGAKDAIGDAAFGSQFMGGVFISAANSLRGSGANAPNGGFVIISAGSVEEEFGGGPGSVILAPGINRDSGATGKFDLVNPVMAYPCMLTAANNFVDSGTTPAGTITFATSSGKVSVTFAGGENWAAIESLLSTNTGISAKWVGPGNAISLVSSKEGLAAELLFIEDSVGGALNAYLGDFSLSGGAAFTPGNYPEFVTFKATGDQELTIGDGTNDLVYDAKTGKLTVPGVIDPTALILEEVDHTTPALSTTNTQGAFFVSDGSDGLVRGYPYFKGPKNVEPEVLGSGWETIVVEAAGGGAYYNVKNFGEPAPGEFWALQGVICGGSAPTGTPTLRHADTIHFVSDVTRPSTGASPSARLTIFSSGGNLAGFGIRASVQDNQIVLQAKVTNAGTVYNVIRYHLCKTLIPF